MNIVYILTNDAMPGIIKIGTTKKEDVRERIDALSSSTAAPLPFNCHFAGDIGDHPENVEKLLHQIFDKYRKNKNREFFWMEPETAVLALRLARVKDVTPQFETAPSTEDAAVINEQRKKKENTKLANYGILPGAELVLSRGMGITCRVVEGNKVEYEGDVMSVSLAAVKALQKLGYQGDSYSGYDYWMYGGKAIWEIREEKDNEQAAAASA